MKTWNVTIPCTMAVAVTVEAEDEEGAKIAAFNVGFTVEVKPDDESKAAAPDVVEFETHDRIAYGNVYCGCICDMEIEEA